VREASAAPPVLGDRPSDEARTWVPASASAQPNQAELPGVALSQRAMVGRESPAGRQGFAHGRPRQQRCRREPQPGKCRAEIPV